MQWYFCDCWWREVSQVLSVVRPRGSWWVQKFIELSMAFSSFGTWCCLTGWVLPSISKEHSAFKMLWSTNSVTQHHILKDLNPHQHQCENLQYCRIKLVNMLIQQLSQEFQGHLPLSFMTCHCGVHICVGCSPNDQFKLYEVCTDLNHVWCRYSNYAI
jgi:hypothetical protein